MDDTQKMEYARAFLQKEVESEFPYPFQILTEEDSFLFCFKNGCRDCCARLKATKGMLDRLCSGDKKCRSRKKSGCFGFLRQQWKRRKIRLFQKKVSTEK